MASLVNLAEVLLFNQNTTLIKLNAVPLKLKRSEVFFIIRYIFKIANVAQLVEHLVEAQSVGGAIPSVCAILSTCNLTGRVAAF